MSNSTQECQHTQQTWLTPQLPRCNSQPSRPLASLAATAKPVAHCEAVRAEFSKADVPYEVTSKVLQQYNCYLRWPIDTKLRPALQLWLEHLGSQQLSERLDKFPMLLRRTPEECNDVYLWLASLGLDAKTIQQKVPRVMARQLNEVQSVVWAIQQVLQLTDEQLPSFFRTHRTSLKYSAERVAHTLQTVAELLALPAASKEMQGVIMVCGQRLFEHEPVSLHHRLSFYCKEFEGGQHAAKAALKQNMYQVSVGMMRDRAANLKAMLGWTKEKLNQAVNSNPCILSVKVSTLASNMQKLKAHNFSTAQALKICASKPNLICYNWSSPSNVEKLIYLMLFLQVTIGEIASNPVLLSVSLDGRIGPRNEFIYRSRGISFDTPLELSGCSSYLSTRSDASFAVRFNKPSANPPLIYDEHFKQHWSQRWKFLRHGMGLSVADISACRALLCTSLPNTLVPRWRFLTQLEAASADFKAADHLMALATLSDQLFVETFDLVDVGLQYDKTLV